MDDSCKMIVAEALISSIGLPPGRLQLQIKGDATMRETAHSRPRINTVLDENFDEFIRKAHKILTQTGVHQLTVCFHNNEIVTRRVFDPYAFMVHDAEAFLEPGYTDRQFPTMDYDDKLNVIKEVYRFLDESKRVKKCLPTEWRTILQENNATWEPITEDDISKVLGALKPLRDIEHYYLRRADICITQKLVEFQFNCDGTHIMNPESVAQFLNDNI